MKRRFTGNQREMFMKLPRRQFLHLAAGAAALPAVSRIARAQAYPSRPVRIVVGFPAGGGSDIYRSLDGPMAFGAARPALRRREPAGCRNQYRDRGSRARASGRLYAPSVWFVERDQRHVLRQASFQSYSRYRASRRHQSRALCHGGKSIGSSQVGSRVYRLRQGQSREDQHGIFGEWFSSSMSPANCSR